VSIAQQAVAALPRRIGLGGRPTAMYLGGGCVAFWLLLALPPNLS
jgi:hypothetical protein